MADFSDRKALEQFCERFAFFTLKDLKKVLVVLHLNYGHSELEGAGINIALKTCEWELHYEAMWIFISV